MARVGLTTTIPVEVLLAGGHTPVDLNNLFIAAEDAPALVSRAELEGYPRNVCGWIKGIYAAAQQAGLDAIVAVTQGDCSQTHAMIETLQEQGMRIVPFAYPYDRDRPLLELQMRRLAEHFQAAWADVEAVREALRPLREKIARLDRLTWEQGRVTGAENHLWQVSCSDFGGNAKGFETALDAFLAQVEHRPPAADNRVRIGFMGVPTIYEDLYEVLEGFGAQVVFNEVQRQFTMADSLDDDIVTQYQRYTYPYDVFGRIEDVRREVARRRIDGIIHYTQSFCFRQIEDMIIKRALSAPVLTLEGDKPSPVDARNRLRIEAFVEMLQVEADY
jgi:benzoyl-CoA reductase/2-hydroxyglutaryl-CoA dehydratase subunit BcrC/BadD/HgdB